MSETIAELKIPADTKYILAAKRTAAAIGSIFGFGIEQLDELQIAVAQACESTMQACRENLGLGCGELRLVFRATESGLQVDVNTCGLPHAHRVMAADEVEESRFERQLLTCFVDELRVRHTATGAMHVKLVKYRLA
ncbi:MAG: ATP-binding protein [Candidatus Dormibacteria bacterium]